MKAHEIGTRTQATDPVQRLISIGFALCAIAAASMPAISWTF